MHLILASIRDHRTTVTLACIGTLLCIAIIFSLTIGAVSIPVRDVAVILVHKLGLFTSVEVDSMYEVVLSSIRIPRIGMTVVIGGALGVSGAALQGLFRNPLVEPSLIGVSAGSAAAVVTLIVFVPAWGVVASGWLFQSLLPIVAFGGGIVATFAVLQLSNQGGKTNIAVLVLTGVAINALAGSIIGLAIFYADENQLRTFTFWTLGDLGGASWDNLTITVPVLIASSGALLFFSRTLNAFALGEAEAYHIGVDVERTKKSIIFFAALAVGVSVSLAGMIGFIGLVVPHLIRILFNADHRLVLPASVLGGALLLVLADAIARTVVSPSELPIGVITAFIGAPFLMALLMKAKNKNEL